MGFNRNPYVEKAEAAQARAQEATDAASEARAYFEAAHLWERAAAKEKPGRRRDEYLAHAEACRGRADVATQRPPVSAADLVAQLKGLRRGGGG